MVSTCQKSGHPLLQIKQPRSAQPSLETCSNAALFTLEPGGSAMVNLWGRGTAEPSLLLACSPPSAGMEGQGLSRSLRGERLESWLVTQGGRGWRTRKKEVESGDVEEGDVEENEGGRRRSDRTNASFRLDSSDRRRGLKGFWRPGVWTVGLRWVCTCATSPSQHTSFQAVSWVFA